MRVELIESSKIEWGCLKPLQPLYKLYYNPLPYPPLVAEFKGTLYLIDGAKRLAGPNTGKVLLDRSINLTNEKDQLSCWTRINKGYREINLLERSLLLGSSYKNLFKLPLNIQYFIAVNEPSYTMLSMLDYAPERILKIIEKVLTLSSPGNSTLKLFLETLFDLNSRNQLESAESPELFKLIEQSGIKDACNRLLKIRNPRLSEKNLLLKKEINDAGIKTIKIEHDENFESAHITIKAELNKADDIDDVIKELEALKKQDKIKKFLDIYES
jgi:hypothetical protein